MRLFFNRWHSVSAADVLGGVFVAHRALLKSFRTDVMAGSGLTPEIAEILIELYLASGTLSSSGHVDVEGFISFRDLLAALDYSPGLLSRRITWLSERQFAEVKRATADVARGIHGNCQRVRITETGGSLIGPVWRRYEKLAERLLAGIPPAELAAHYRINETISDKLSGPAFRMQEASATVERLAHKSKPPPPLSPLPESQVKSIILEPEKEFLD